jgi:hypothetical protein
MYEICWRAKNTEVPVSYKKTYALIILAIAIIVCRATLSHADVSVEYVQVKEITFLSSASNKKFAVKAFQAKPRYSEALAKLCFFKEGLRHCFDAEASFDGTMYDFQYVNELSKVELLSKNIAKQALLFIAEHSGGGSGSLKLITFWLPDIENGSMERLLPLIAITEQGEYRLLKGKKGQSVLVTADYIWGDGETHFSPHKFKIKIYHFSQAQKAFVLRNEYTTGRTYKSLDDADEIDVITPELDYIKKYTE